MVLGVKKISPQEWKQWKPKYDAATKAMQNRDEQMQAVQAEIEQDLYIIGATAIEDRLQDEVRKSPYCVALF